MDLKLTVFPSCLGIMILGSSPLLEEALGIIVVVRVEGVRQRFRCGGGGRCSIGGPTGPGRRRKESVIQDKSVDKLEDDLLP